MNQPAQGLEVLWIILLVAAATWLTRVLPFVLFRPGRPIPAAVGRLGQTLPYGMISILVVYCLRGIQLTGYPFGLPELIAVAVAVGVHLWKRNNLLSIGLSTVIYMVLVQKVF